MTYDASDPDSVAEEDAWLRGRDTYRAEAWEWLIRDARGRSVLADILHTTGYMQQTFRPGMADVSAFLEGQRVIGLAIHEKIALLSPEFIPDIERQLRELTRDVGSTSSSDH